MQPSPLKMQPSPAKLQPSPAKMQPSPAKMQPSPSKPGSSPKIRYIELTRPAHHRDLGKVSAGRSPATSPYASASPSPFTPSVSPYASSSSPRHIERGRRGRCTFPEYLVLTRVLLRQECKRHCCLVTGVIPNHFREMGAHSNSAEFQQTDHQGLDRWSKKEEVEPKWRAGLLCYNVSFTHG